MERLLNVMTGLSLLLILMVLVSVRRARIRVEYSVAWLLGAVALLGFSRARGLLRWNRRLSRRDLSAAGVDVISGLCLSADLLSLLAYHFSIEGR